MTMNTNEIKITQKMVDAAAAAIQSEEACTPAKVKGYQVAKRLGCSAGGKLYEMLADWRKRQAQIAGSSHIYVPPEAENTFQEGLKQSNETLLAIFRRSTDAVAQYYHGLAQSSIAVDRQRAEQAEEENADIIEQLCKTENDLKLEWLRTAKLDEDLKAAQRRNERLMGHLEELRLNGAMAASSKREAEVALQEEEEEEERSLFPLGGEAGDISADRPVDVKISKVDPTDTQLPFQSHTERSPSNGS
ncbi:hypothetical protein [Sphingobium sp. BS19]|uniref:hypothetical protein n=1 Tax=Sphingobium sp. BS19 TaxID=3018973 RepID=UPI0022EE1259|nr:hypothetical protein [Sphingobium sp. BS19]GLI97034.1 hypothetical protein Sbs19_08520 [Sphingobium sp. BS19]